MNTDDDHPPSAGDGPGSAHGGPGPASDGGGNVPPAEHSCDDAVELIYEYLDGELDVGTLARIEVHLKRCSPCLEAYDFHAELRQVVRAKCSQSMPEELRSRLLRMLADPPG